ncbi:MAG TPA: hypothetical protein VKB24_10470 [Candidatus Acidoferrum sp.]|nr:hypothetical protein [Candidatus Acidoferrum sp.]
MVRTWVRLVPAGCISRNAPCKKAQAIANAIPVARVVAAAKIPTCAIASIACLRFAQTPMHCRDHLHRIEMIRFTEAQASIVRGPPDTLC